MAGIPRNYDAELYRKIEQTKAFLTLNVVSSRPGKQSKLIENQEDYGIYLEGVMTALSVMSTPNCQIKTDTFEDAMQTGDTKVLRIFAEAAEDVNRARNGISIRAKHVASVITAKLYLETMLGGLPTQSATKKMARDLFRYEFKMEAYPIDNYKEWQEIIIEAGLGYLPTRSKN
jgi:hypothetical protein